MMSRPQPRYSKGERIGGRYLVYQALMGGMGEVYLCLDEKPPIEPIALKTFQSNSPDLANIFRREVASWIALERHPNIVRCSWMETYDNIPFMALEWVAGEEGKGTDLRSWVRGGSLDLALALKFTIDIVRGLQHANQKSTGIVHRDLKPENVLVNQSRQAKITDFGLAMVAQLAKLYTVSPNDEVKLGQSQSVGNIVGTPMYMPPEQWRGEIDLDFRTDLYAVGCILYELLTGKLPYNGCSIAELREQHLQSPLPSLGANVPPEVQHIIDVCLAKRREDRFERLELLLEELKQVYEACSGESLPDVSAEEFTAIDYLNRGLTFNNLGQYERAIADFDQALHLNSKLPLAYNNRGATFRNLGQEQRAIADFDQALRLDPNLALAYSNRGLSCSKLGQYERAIADFDQALRLDPNLALAYSNRGLNYSRLGKEQQAIADFDRALRLDSTFIPAYVNRGNSYGQLGQYERALADYDQALRLDPNDAQVYYNRANEYSRLGREQQALADYDQALRLDPRYAAAYSNRGLIYSRLGREQQALADYDQALHLNPNLAEVYINRGGTYNKLGQAQRAIADYDQALHIDPKLAIAYSNRGNSYMDMRQYQQALADFEQALRLNPNLAIAWFNKGAVLANTDRLQEALACFEKAHTLGYPQATGAIQQVRQMLGSTSLQNRANPNDPQAAFEAFQQAGSPGAMRQAVGQFGSGE